jgi:hypothetical protein
VRKTVSRTEDNVSCLLKSRIAEQEKITVVRQWLFKHVSTATKSRDRCNNIGAIRGSVFDCDHAEAV